MVQEAQELRAKVLADLTRRRRVLHSQIEQLRAGRERLAETITGVRNSVDVIADELFRAEDEARLAAEEAGRQAAAQVDGRDDARAPGRRSAAATATVEVRRGRRQAPMPATGNPTRTSPPASRRSRISSPGSAPNAAGPARR